MIEVYCDESRPELLSTPREKINSTDEKYMLIGGIWVPYATREELKNAIKNLREKHLVFGEIKWRNVSPSKVDFYRELVELFFNFEGVRFRCVVVDATKVQLDRYHESDSELGFYKFYYQLLKHWIDDRETYWIYLDYKKNKLSNRLQKLKEVLDNATYNQDLIEDVQAIDSKESLLIQVADVLTGAVGYRYNHGYSSEAKKTIVSQVEYHLGHRIRKSYKSEYKFNVFEIALN